MTELTRLQVLITMSRTLALSRPANVAQMALSGKTSHIAMRPDQFGLVGSNMIDRILASSITTFAESRADLRMLTDEAATELTNEIRRRFVSESSQRWWWTTLCAAHQVHEYGDGDGLSLLIALAGGRSDIFTLLVSDDEFPPWPAVRGTLSGLVAMLRELRYFEYLLVDDSLRWVLFDTHHNCIVDMEEPRNVPKDGISPT